MFKTVSGRSMATVAATALALALAGCGGGSAQPHRIPFRRGFEDATGQLRGVGAAIEQALGRGSAQSSHQLGITFEELARTWEVGVRDLRRLSPPPSQARAFGGMLAAATRIEDDLNAVVAAAQTHSASAARTAEAKLTLELGKVASASGGTSGAPRRVR